MRARLLVGGLAALVSREQRASRPDDPVARDQGHGSHSALVEPRGDRGAQSVINDRFSDTSSRSRRVE